MFTTLKYNDSITGFTDDIIRQAEYLSDWARDREYKLTRLKNSKIPVLYLNIDNTNYLNVNNTCLLVAAIFSAGLVSMLMN